MIYVTRYTLLALSAAIAAAVFALHHRVLSKKQLVIMVICAAIFYFASNKQAYPAYQQRYTATSSITQCDNGCVEGISAGISELEYAMQVTMINALENGIYRINHYPL